MQEACDKHTLYPPRHGNQGQVAGICNRRSAVAPAKPHRLCSIFTYSLNGLRKGDKQVPQIWPDALPAAQPTASKH